jgi:hypothetical protein
MRWIRVLALVVVGCACGLGLRAQDSQAAISADPNASAAQDSSASTPAQNSQATQSQPSSQQQQGSTQQQGAGTGGASGAPAQSAGGASASAKKGNAGGSASAVSATPNAAEADEHGGNLHTLAGAVSIPLGANWGENAANELPPPPELQNYAPPFRISAILPIQNSKSGSILQLVISDNPLLGKDSNWLDEQMHKPAGSGLSVLDMLYYFFFPPTQQCMVEAQNTVAKATFAPSPAAASASATGAPAPSSGDSTDPEMQLTYQCKRDASLESFYATQLSNGITFVQTNSGPRAFSVVPQFYLGPMERVQAQGITWYVFEAQRTEPVPMQAMQHFRSFGPALDGAQADFFWAIGAPDPLPFSADTAGATDSRRLIHVAYASVSSGTNNHDRFVTLLQRVQVRGVNPQQ